MRKFKTVADRTVRIFENVENMVEVFKQVSPQKKMLAAQIDTQGARLIG